MDFNYFFYFTDEETGHRGEIAQGHSILSEFEDKPRSAGCKAIIFPVQQAVLCSQESMESQRLSGGN